MPDPTMTPAREARRNRSTRKREQAEKTHVDETSIRSVIGEPFTLTLGGREWDIRPLTYNCLVTAEERGLDTGAILKDAGSLTARAIRCFVWFMLQRIDPDLTEEQVGEWLPIRQDEVIEIVLKLFKASGAYKAESEKGASAGGPPELSTGSTSSES